MSEFTQLEESLRGALIAGIQTGVGEAFHPDAKALVMIAFKDAVSAEKFRMAYLDVRSKLTGESHI